MLSGGAAGRDVGGFAGADSGGGGALGGSDAVGGTKGAAGASGRGGSGAVIGYEPCANPKDVSGGHSGNLGIPGSSSNNGPAACLRTTESFDTIICTSVPPFLVNGAPVMCNQQSVYPPSIDGYNYFDIPAGSSDGANIQWFINM
jgi:hypothetical protein